MMAAPWLASGAALCHPSKLATLTTVSELPGTALTAWWLAKPAVPWEASEGDPGLVSPPLSALFEGRWGHWEPHGLQERETKPREPVWCAHVEEQAAANCSLNAYKFQ